MDFEKWVENNWNGLRVLMLSNEFYKPGCLVSRTRHDIITYAWDAIGEKGDEPHWELAEGKATIVTGQFDREVSVKSSFKLLGLISFAGDLGKSVTGTFDVSDTRVRRLKRLPRMQLDKKLRTIKKPGSTDWLKIDGRLVIEECYYATHLKATFREGGSVLTQAKVEQIVKPSVEAGVEAKWRNDQVLEMTSDGTVPFGVRGWLL